MSEAKENPRCLVHYHMIPDGQCSCPHECQNCGVTYVGGHSKEECVTVLKRRLKLNELAEKIEALSVGREPMSREKLIAAAKADLLANLSAGKQLACIAVGGNPDYCYSHLQPIVKCTQLCPDCGWPKETAAWTSERADATQCTNIFHQAHPEPASDECEGDKCWFNQETGYTEYCPKHEAIIADKAMESPNWASPAPATIPNISADMIRRGYKWEPVEPAEKLSVPEPIEEDWQEVDRLIGNRMSSHAYAVAYWKCRQRELAVSQAENKALKHTVADLSGKVAKLCFEAQVPAERSRKAARELVSFLDISFPRGRAYANSLEETMAICIEQNMKGIHRSWQ